MFFQAEDGIRDLVRSRGLGDVYKRQPECRVGGEVNNSVILGYSNKGHDGFLGNSVLGEWCNLGADTNTCLLYTSDAADERSSVDLGGRRIIKKKKKMTNTQKKKQHTNNKKTQTSISKS